MSDEIPTAVFFAATNDPGRVRCMPTVEAVEKRPHLSLSDIWIPSRFNVPVNLPDNQMGVYNTASTALAIITEEMWRKYFAVRFEYPVSGAPIPKSLQMLQGKGFFVSKGIDEIELVRLKYLASRHGHDTLAVNILATLNCNLRCPYCFEGRVQESGTRPAMTPETENAAVGYLSKLAEGKKGVRINWFGGEPLLNMEAITRMSGRLLPDLDQRGIKYGAVVITNGTLLSREVVDRLRACRVSQAQVTVDVPKTTKRDGSGRDTLEKVLDNVTIAAETMDVYIRVNLTRDDEAEFDQLYRGLVGRNLQTKLKFINIAHVFMPEGGRSGCGQCGFPHQTYVEIERRERAKANALGIPMKTFLQLDGISGCSATCASSVTIDPDGLLYKCVEDAGLADRAFGSVFHVKHVKSGNLLPWLTYDWFQHEMCRECLVLPQCAGGCAHKRLFQSDGLHDEDFCYWHLRGDLENRIREVALSKKRGANLQKMVKINGQN